MPSLTITIIQSNLHWQDKQANLAMFEQKINSVTEKTELIILPEMFSTGFSMEPAQLAEPMDGPTVNWMKRLAAAKRVVLTGSIIVEADGHYYNRLIWMLPTGRYGIYDKRHRFAYAGEDQAFTAGTKRLIASVKGWRINLLVCYDLRFPVWSRQMLPAAGLDGHSMEYDVLVYVANWPERRNHAWKTLLQARAIENQCFVIGVNRVGDDGKGLHYSGDSMIVDPMGKVLHTKAEAEDIFTMTLEQETLREVREKLPFWKDGDAFSIFP